MKLIHMLALAIALLVYAGPGSAEQDEAQSASEEMGAAAQAAEAASEAMDAAAEAAAAAGEAMAAAAESAGDAAAAGGAIDTAALWKKNCTSCHGDTGKADTKVGKMKKIRDMTDPEVCSTFDRESAIKATKEGVVDPESGKSVMKGYAEKLTEEEIGALADHVLAFCQK